MAITKTLTAEEIALLNNLCPVAQRAELGDFLSEVQALLAAIAGTSTVSIAAILGTAKNLDYLRLAELQHSDNEVLVFGTGVGVGGDISTKFDGSDLITSIVGASEGWKIGAASHVLDITLHGSLTLGVDDTGYDMKLFGATASKYLWWDQAHDSLFIVGALDVTGATLLKGTVGMGTNGTTFTVAADGALAIATDKLTVTVAGLLTVASRMDAKGGFKGGTNLTEFIVGADGSIAVVTDKFTVSAAGVTGIKNTLTVGVDDTGYDVKFFGATAGKYMLWDESEDALVVDTIRALATADLELETVAVNTNVRINCRTFTGTASESIIGMQVKPRAGDNRTAGIFGAEYEPGINEGFTGTDLIGVASRPVIKASVGTPGGDLSGDVRAYEASIGTYDTSTRTIGGTMSALWASNNAYGTITGGVYPIHVPAAGGGTVPWSGFAKLPEDNAMAGLVSAQALPACAAWIRVKIGTTFFRIAAYNNA